MAPCLHPDFPQIKMQFCSWMGAPCSCSDSWGTIRLRPGTPVPLHANRDKAVPTPQQHVSSVTSLEQTEKQKQTEWVRNLFCRLD